MIIKNAAIIFNHLTNKLYSSKTFETIECSKWTNSIGGAGFGTILDGCNRKNISDCNQSVFLMLIKKQNNSHQSSLLTGPNGFLNSSKLMYPFLYLKDYGRIDFQKCFVF